MPYTVYGSFSRFTTDSAVVKKKGESQAIPVAVQQQNQDQKLSLDAVVFCDQKALVSRTQKQVSPKTR